MIKPIVPLKNCLFSLSLSFSFFCFPCLDIPTLSTETVILRKIELSDVNDIFEFTSDPEVAKLTSMFTLHTTKKETYSYIENLFSLYIEGKVIPWAIVDKKNNKIIGIIRFVNYSSLHARADIGYTISRPYWNQGIATQAAKEIINFGFTVLDLNRIQGTCDSENNASSRILEKCGMQYEGLLHKYVISQGKPCDRKIYAIIKEDYIAK